jgi:hypothetical protein
MTDEALTSWEVAAAVGWLRFDHRVPQHKRPREQDLHVSLRCFDRNLIVRLQESLA